MDSANSVKEGNDEDDVYGGDGEDCGDGGDGRGGGEGGVGEHSRGGGDVKVVEKVEMEILAEKAMAVMVE